MITTDYSSNSNYTITTTTLNNEAVTIPNPSLPNDYTLYTSPEPSSITLGKVVLTEQKLERLSALLDLIEGMGTGDLLDMLNTQTALNKVNHGTTESD